MKSNLLLILATLAVGFLLPIPCFTQSDTTQTNTLGEMQKFSNDTVSGTYRVRWHSDGEPFRVTICTKHANFKSAFEKFGENLPDTQVHGCSTVGQIVEELGEDKIYCLDLPTILVYRKIIVELLGSMPSKKNE
jgi:hypothetical protein